MRLWDTKDGAFLAETEPRPERLKFLNFGQLDPWEEIPGRVDCLVTELSNERHITWTEVITKISPSHSTISYPGPVELWDAMTGRLIAQIDQTGISRNSTRFFGDGKFIRGENGNGVCIFSPDNGDFVANLDCGEEFTFSFTELHLTPSGRNAAVVCFSRKSHGFYVCIWDTASWKLSSITGPLDWAPNFDLPYELQLIADDLFAMSECNGTSAVFRPATATPVARLPGLGHLYFRDGYVLDSAQLFDTQTWRRLQPPKERKYHPDLARFAPDGRFLRAEYGGEEKALRDGFEIIDTATEKSFVAVGHEPKSFPKLGWVWLAWNGNTAVRLPSLDQLAIPPDMLELWAQVAVRGQLDDEGLFVKWDEETWEKKRQELAAKPAPYPDSPFPGHVANDKLHWLRQEYEQADDADKPILARQLLDRSEAAGDEVEAVRWRSVLSAAEISSPEADSE